MSKKKGGFSILHKVLLAMFFISLIPLAGFWFVSNSAFQANLEAQIDSDLRKTAHVVVRKANDWTDMNIRLLRQNSMLDSMVSMETSRQQPIIDAITETYEWTFLVYAVDREGYMTARSDGKAILKPDGTRAHYRGDRMYYAQIMNGEPLGQQVLLSRTLGDPAFILCHPIKDAGGKIQGAFCVGTKLVDMSTTVTDIKIGQTGYAILLDRDGKAIAHGNPGKVKAVLQDLSDHPAIADGRIGEKVIYNQGGKRMVAYSETTNQGWTVIVEREYNDAFSALAKAKINGLILLGGTAVLVILTAVFLAGRLTGPIRNLTKSADTLSRGVENVNISEVNRSDEIGDMALAIERMGSSIKIAMSKLKRRKGV